MPRTASLFRLGRDSFEEDLWGRYHFTSILLKGAECREIEPRTLEEAAKKSIGKKGKAKAPRRLYRAWLESRTDCLLKMTSLAGDEVFPHESSWATSTEKAILGGISQFESRIKDFLRAEAPSLDRHRELEKETRENLYRLLNGIELQIKKLKNQHLESQHLEAIRKQVDSLIVRISSSS